jgi:hypothetical protein
MADTTVKRHALGLPEGSIRALLALLVVGLACAIFLVPTSVVTPIPIYLLLLLFLVISHFFAAHAPGSFPLYLPINLVRLLIMGALVATIGFKLVTDTDGLKAQMEWSQSDLNKHWYLPLLLIGGFFIGLIFRMIVGRDNPSYFVQDLEAWLALIAVLGLVIAAFIHLVINPSLEENNPISLGGLGGFLAVVIAFYFGARS